MRKLDGKAYKSEVSVVGVEEPGLGRRGVMQEWRTVELQLGHYDKLKYSVDDNAKTGT